VFAELQPTDFIFLPPDTMAPILFSTSPADNGTDVAVFNRSCFDLSESVKAASGTINIHKSSDSSTVSAIAITDTGQISFSGDTVRIDPTSDLAGSTAYYVTISPGVLADLSGNEFGGIASSSTFSFTPHRWTLFHQYYWTRVPVTTPPTLRRTRTSF